MTPTVIKVLSILFCGRIKIHHGTVVADFGGVHFCFTASQGFLDVWPQAADGAHFGGAQIPMGGGARSLASKIKSELARCVDFAAARKERS